MKAKVQTDVEYAVKTALQCLQPTPTIQDLRQLIKLRLQVEVEMSRVDDAYFSDWVHKSENKYCIWNQSTHSFYWFLELCGLVIFSCKLIRLWVATEFNCSVWAHALGVQWCNALWSLVRWSCASMMLRNWSHGFDGLSSAKIDLNETIQMGSIVNTSRANPGLTSLSIAKSSQLCRMKALTCFNHFPVN